MKIVFRLVGCLMGLIYFPRLAGKIQAIGAYLNTGYWSYWFQHIGKGTFIERHCVFVGFRYISIGQNCKIGNHTRITAYDSFAGVSFSPRIQIGNNCSIGSRSHLTAIHSIQIGDGVLMGNDVLITDNSHGDISYSNLPPEQRTLKSKGPVVIADNVWIGEKACIMPGVHICEGAIVAAGAVVTHDVPPFSVVAGVPAKCIKILRQ